MWLQANPETRHYHDYCHSTHHLSHQTFRPLIVGTTLYVYLKNCIRGIKRSRGDKLISLIPAIAHIILITRDQWVVKSSSAGLALWSPPLGIHPPKRVNVYEAALDSKIKTSVCRRWPQSSCCHVTAELSTFVGYAVLVLLSPSEELPTR